MWFCIHPLSAVFLPRTIIISGFPVGRTAAVIEQELPRLEHIWVKLSTKTYFRHYLSQMLLLLHHNYAWEYWPLYWSGRCWTFPLSLQVLQKADSPSLHIWGSLSVEIMVTTALFLIWSISKEFVPNGPWWDCEWICGRSRWVTFRKHCS